MGADESFSFDPDSIASTSDAASKAGDEANTASAAAVTAQSKASDASSAAVVAQSKASDASSAVVKLMRTVILKVYNEASDVSTGDGKMYFAAPNILSGMNLVSAGAHIYSSTASGKVEVMINNVTSGADMLTSAIEIDAGEIDSVTASSACAIDTSNDGVAAGEALRVDVDVAGSTAKGLEVRLTFQKP